MPIMQAVLVPELPGAGKSPDCVACNFGRGRTSIVTAYADGCMAVWDLRNVEEV